MDKLLEQKLNIIARELGYALEEIDDKLLNGHASKQAMMNIGNTLSRLSSEAYMEAGRLEK